VFYSATDLTRASEEKLELMLEASAIFDYLAGDLARVPYTENRMFYVGDGGYTLIFRALNRTAGGDDVYIRYQYLSGSPYGTIERGVYSSYDAGSVSGPVDEDGDGHNDTGMVVGRWVNSFGAAYHVSGSISPDPSAAGWGTTTVTDTRAVRFEMTLGTNRPDKVLGNQDFDVIIPVMPR
jgi:hypothetical protein